MIFSAKIEPHAGITPTRPGVTGESGPPCPRNEINVPALVCLEPTPSQDLNANNMLDATPGHATQESRLKFNEIMLFDGTSRV